MDDEPSPELKGWLQDIGTGPNLTGAIAAWKETLHGARDLLSVDATSATDQPPIPSPYLEELIRVTHNRFSSEVETRYQTLRRLHQHLKSDVSDLDNRYQQMQQCIIKSEAAMEEYAALADQYSTLREVVADDALPKTASVWLREEQLMDSADEEARDQMPAIHLRFDADRSHQFCVAGNHSPMRAAACARTVRRSLLEDWLPLYRQFAVADLRFRILRYVLVHFETVGVPPSLLTDEDAKTLAEYTALPDARFDLKRTIQEVKPLLDAGKRRFRKSNGEINWAAIHRTLNKQEDSPLQKRTDGENITYQAFMQYKNLYLRYTSEERESFLATEDSKNKT